SSIPGFTSEGSSRPRFREPARGRWRLRTRSQPLGTVAKVTDAPPPASTAPWPPPGDETEAPRPSQRSRNGARRGGDAPSNASAGPSAEVPSGEHVLLRRARESVHPSGQDDALSGSRAERGGSGGEVGRRPFALLQRPSPPPARPVAVPNDSSSPLSQHPPPLSVAAGSGAGGRASGRPVCSARPSPRGLPG
ncbi:atherin-like, partial [Nothobranchius furzeri]